MMQSARDAAAQPPPMIVYFGAPSFYAVFSGVHAMTQCEGVRSAVAPTLDDANEELAIFQPHSTPCGPCTQDVLNVLLGEAE